MTTIPFATSGFSPAVATFHSRIHVAWTPTTSEIRVASSDTGENWGNDHGLGEYSYHAPALAVFQDRLYIAWTGTDANALLTVKSSRDGETFDPDTKVPLSESSFYGPALAVFQDPLANFQERLYIAWTGADEQRSLNIRSSADGKNWQDSDKHPLGQTSIGAPALAAQPDPSRLFIGWTTGDKSLNIARSADGATFDFGDTRIPNEQSNQRPALRPWGLDGLPVMWFCWTGTDARLNILNSVNPDVDNLPESFGDKATSSDTSIDAPSLGWWSYDLEDGFIAWSGTDDEHHVNVKGLGGGLPW